MLTSRGSAKFYFYRKISGQPRRYPIASGSISVDDARKLVRNERVEYANENDLRSRRQADRRQLTLRQLLDHWRGKVRRIPANSAKGKRMISVPLSDDAVAILKPRHVLKASEKCVFPSHSVSSRIMDPKGAWRRLLARAGLNGIQMYDLRRTVGSYAAMAGVSDRLIGGMLGPTTQQATAVYARLLTEPVRAAMAAGMAALQAAKAAAISDAATTRKLSVLVD